MRLLVIRNQTGTDRTVLRPGLGQYIFNSMWPTLPTVFGLFVIVAALSPAAQDRWGLIAVGLVLVALGAIAFAYLYGMTVEIDDERVAKVYFFGLFRHSIRRQDLRSSHHEESGSSDLFSITVFDFSSTDKQVWGFSLIPFWVWHKGDVNELFAMSAESERARAEPWQSVTASLPTRARRADGTEAMSLVAAERLRSDERQSDETGWAILLSLAALLALAVGIWAATQSHNWTPLWVLNVVGGLLSYIPMVAWIAYGTRVPERRLILWPARVLTLILTGAIPLTVWSFVPGPS